MKFVVRFLLVLFVAVLGLQQAKAQTVTASPNTIQWKDIYPYDTVSQQVVLTNTSTASVSCIISNLHYPFWTHDDTIFTLSPQATKTITIFFVTTDVQGAAF